jgi:hypothetical protein
VAKLNKQCLLTLGKQQQNRMCPENKRDESNQTTKMKASDVSCGLAHELAIVLAKAGWEISDLDALAKSEDRCRDVLPFLRGNAQINIVEHIIDCSTTPFCPEGWTILPLEEQIPTRYTGQLKWDRKAQTEAFYLSQKQTTGDKWIEGNKLCEELVKKLVVALPANVLDYLLANPILIPEEWKGKAIFFWGTIYRSSGGSLCVRYLYWGDGAWDWSSGWLDYDFDSGNLALLPASQN